MRTVGDILREAREKGGVSLKEISVATKIKEKFLEQIESNQYSAFSSRVALGGFIKNYAEFLGLEMEKILPLMRRDLPASPRRALASRGGPVSPAGPASSASREGRKFSWTPKTTRILAIFLALALFISYLVWQYLKLIQTPYK